MIRVRGRRSGRQCTTDVPGCANHEAYGSGAGSLQVTKKTRAVRAALHTILVPVILDPFSFAVMSGTDDVVIMGNPTLKALGIDIFDSLGKCARARERFGRGEG